MNTLELPQIYINIETKTIQLSHSFCFDLFLEDSKGRICTKMSSFFPCFKTKPVIWHAGKNQKNYYLISFWKKLYRKKWTHTFLRDFFSLWIRNWGEQRDENKVKIQYVFNKLLFKIIIVFTSIYFDNTTAMLP